MEAQRQSPGCQDSGSVRTSCRLQATSRSQHALCVLQRLGLLVFEKEKTVPIFKPPRHGARILIAALLRTQQAYWHFRPMLLLSNNWLPQAETSTSLVTRVASYSSLLPASSHISYLAPSRPGLHSGTNVYQPDGLGNVPQVLPRQTNQDGRGNWVLHQTKAIKHKVYKLKELHLYSHMLVS